MMPPPGTERPDEATLDALAASLETQLDRRGRRAPQSRPPDVPAAEPRRVRRVDPRHARRSTSTSRRSCRPTPSATTSTTSPTCSRCRRRCSRATCAPRRRSAAIAVGDPEASPNSTIYKVPRTASQLAHVDGAPFGTRGGISVIHNFPADGEYTFRMMLHSIPTGQLYGSTVRGEQIEVSINGQRVALLDINPRMSESDPNGMNLQTPPIVVKAGPQRVSAAFIRAVRSAGRRSARADRADARRHADRQLDRRHDAAAPARPRRRRAAEGDRRVGHAEPPPGLHLPAAGSQEEEPACATKIVADAGDAGLPPSGDARRSRRA